MLCRESSIMLKLNIERKTSMTNQNLISLLLTGTMLFSFSLVIYFVVAVA